MKAASSAEKPAITAWRYRGQRNEWWEAPSPEEEHEGRYREQCEEEVTDSSSSEGEEGTEYRSRADQVVDNRRWLEGAHDWIQDSSGWWSRVDTPPLSPEPEGLDPIGQWWRDPVGEWHWHIDGAEGAQQLYERRERRRAEIFDLWKKILVEQYRKFRCLYQLVTSRGWQGVGCLFFARAVRFLLLREEAWVSPPLRRSCCVEVPRSTRVCWRWRALVDRNQRVEAAVDVWKQTRWYLDCGLRFKTKAERLRVKAEREIAEAERRVRDLARWQVRRGIRLSLERLCEPEEEETVPTADAAAGQAREVEAEKDEDVRSESSGASLQALIAENQASRRAHFERCRAEGIEPDAWRQGAEERRKRREDEERWRRAGWRDYSRGGWRNSSSSSSGGRSSRGHQRW